MGRLWGCLVVLGWMVASLSYAAVEPTARAFARLDAKASYLRMDPKGTAIAYTDPDGANLRVVELKSGRIWKVTAKNSGGSHFWAPDGFRLFYRVLLPGEAGASSSVRSEVFAFDRALRRSLPIDRVGSSSGYLTFDPRDYRMQLLHERGILSKRLVFPDERLARWQAAQRTDRGKWLVAQNGVLWSTQAGYALRKMEESGGRVLSFDISPDGHSIAWASDDGKVYVSRDGAPARSIGYGRDPAWHPENMWLVYSGAIMVGNVAVSHDLRVVDEKGVSRWITRTQDSSERWPQWHPDGRRVICVMDRSPDLYAVDLDAR